MSALDDYLEKQAAETWWNNPVFDTRGAAPYENYDDQSLLSYWHDNLAAGTGAFMQTAAHLLGDNMSPEALADSYDIPWLEQTGKELQQKYSHNYTPGTLGYYGAAMLQSAPEMTVDMVASALGAAAASSVLGPAGTVAGTAARTAATAGKWGRRALRFYEQSQSPLAKAARYMTPSYKTTLATITGTPLEASFEGQRAMDDYIEDAKRNGTYMPGETENEARALKGRVFRDNMLALTGTNGIENALTFGKGNGLRNGLRRLAGASATEGLEEGIQQIIPKAEQGQAWSITDPDVLESAAIGAVMGGGMHLGGRAINHFLPENAPQQAGGVIRDYGKADAYGMGQLDTGLTNNGGFADAMAYAGAPEFNEAQGLASSLLGGLPASSYGAGGLANNAAGGAMFGLSAGGANTATGNTADPVRNPKADTRVASQIPDLNVTAPNMPVVSLTSGNDAGRDNGKSDKGTKSGLTEGFNEWAGKRMDNGRNGCVEAVGKMGSHYSSFLAEENAKGVVYVPTLVKDAGDRVIPYDASKVERGDVIVYGDDDHVVIADGNGGYYGNSSSREQVVHGDDINDVGLEPTKIIKVGGDTQESAGSGELTKSSGNEQYDAWIKESAERNGIPANLLSAMIDQESSYDPNAKSDAGAIGLAQLMPSTAEELGVDPTDPQQAIEGGARYLKQKYDKYGNWHEALEAYNGGDGNVGTKETKAHADKVLSKAGDISTESSHKGSSFAQDVVANASSDKPYVEDFFAGFFDDFKASSTDPNLLGDLEDMTTPNGGFRNTAENRLKLAQKYAQELQDYANTLYATRTNPEPEQYVPMTQQPKAVTATTGAQTGEPQKIEMSTNNLQKAKASSALNTHNAPQTAQNAVQAVSNTEPVQTPMQSNNTRQTANQQGDMDLAGAARALTRFAVGKVTEMEAKAGNSTPESMRLRQAIQQGDAGTIMSMYPQESAGVLASYMNANAQPTRKGTQTSTPQDRNANATPLMLQQGQNLINLAQQNNVALPKPMIYALNRGSQTAIGKATDTLNNAGVAVPQAGAVASEEMTNNVVDNQKQSNGTQGASAPRTQGEANQVLRAEPAQADEPQRVAQGTVSNNFTTGTYRHTKKQVDMPSAKLTEHTTSDNFKRLKGIAKDNGGYYSRFAKQFLFNDEAGRDAFMRAADSEVFGEQPTVRDNTQEPKAAQSNTQEQAKQGEREAEKAEQGKSEGEKPEQGEKAEDSFIHYTQNHIEVNIDLTALDAVVARYPQIKPVIDTLKAEARTDEKAGRQLGQLLALSDDEQATAVAGYIYNQAKVNYLADRKLGRPANEEAMSTKIVNGLAVINRLAQGKIAPRDAYAKLTELFDEQDLAPRRIEMETEQPAKEANNGGGGQSTQKQARTITQDEKNYMDAEYKTRKAFYEARDGVADNSMSYDDAVKKVNEAYDNFAKVSPNEAERGRKWAMKRLDYINREKHPEIEAKEKADAEAAEAAKYHGFLDDKTKLSAGNAKKVLSVREGRDGVYKTRKEHTEQAAKDPNTRVEKVKYKGKTEYRLFTGRSTFYTVTKTEYDYFNYLRDHMDKAQGEQDNSIFGSVEDADKELLEAFGIDPNEEETFTAPEGITNTAEERARLEKELEAELNKLGANPVFNPKIYELSARLAMTYVKDGINTAKKLIAALQARFGDKIGPWAPAIVETVRTWPKGVAFEPAKVRAVAKAVGARYEQGIRTRDDMHTDMQKMLKGRYKSFEPMIDAAYNGIEKFFNPATEEVTANGQVQRKSGSSSGRPENVPAEEVQSNQEGRRGPDGRSGEVSGGRDEVAADDAGHAEEADTAEHSTGRDGVETARGRDAGRGAGERGHHELAPLRDDQEHPAASKSAGHNYEIKGKGREANEPAKRHADNVKAIKLLKKLEAENRMPTPAEQKVLAGYSGWGGLTNSFTDPQKNSELKELLTKEEYDRAQASIRDAYFTPPDIVRAIWKGVSSLGFKGGKVLDPSMGTGNFYGCMPRDMMQASSLYGIELDPLSSRFAQMLYPSAHVENTGFQNAHVADNYFDLVVSNVPFSQEKVGKYALHNFFFANGIDKVRPGGLMVFITSQGSLTSSGDAAVMRSYLSSKADFIGGFKLPSGTFKGTGTDVATDVLVFQRRGKDNISSKYAQNMNAMTDYTFTSKDGWTHASVKANKYFYSHPENVLGVKELGKDRYGKPALNILPKKGQDTAKELAKAMGKLPHDIYKPINRTNTKPYQQVESDRKARANDKKRDLEYFERDGKVYQNQGEENAVQVTGKKLPKIRAYLKVKEALSSLFIAQNDPKVKDSALNALRKKLNTAYDAFVGKYGYLNDRANELAFGDDPHAGTVMALETDIKAEGKGAKRRVLSAEKADIFYRRTVQAVKPLTHVDSAKDALLASLNNKGAVDVDYMAELTGKNPEAVVKELGDKLYKDPVTETYQADDEYLSGNVREKLEQAQEAAKADPAYQRNVDALKKVVPADLVSSEIAVNMNAPWLPVEDINDFLNYLMQGGYGSLKVYRTNANGKIIVEGYGRNSKWESDGADIKFLLENLLNNKPIQVFDRGDHNKNLGLNQKKTDAANAAAERITDEFRNWIWSDKAREKRLVAYYNAHFNGEVLRKYDGSHLTFPGMTSGIKLRAHQKNVVWRIMQKANTLIAHCVGAGKTFEMQTAGMEMRRLGIANKPLYCVPNNVVEQFARDFYKLYPNAKLLVLRTADDIPEVFSVKGEKTEDGRKVVRVLKPSEMTAADRAKYEEKCRKRMRALTRIKAEDWDGIIMSHDMFTRLPVSGETVAEYIRAEIALLDRTIREAKEKEGVEIDGNVLRRLEDSKASLENRLNEALSEDKYAVGIPFEELGIDQIFVDEADMFKNLHYSTAIGGVSGLANSNAHRSTDMFLKTQWLTKHNGGRGVVFATGTPISNTMAEMYTMMRYLDRDGLKEDNVDIFDNWIRSYAEIGTGIERKPDGNGYRKVNKVKRFINMPELVKRFRKFTDVFTRDELEAEDPNIKLPKLKGGKRTVIALPVDPVVGNYIKNVVPDRVAAMKKGRRKMGKGDDNMLALTNDLRKLSMTDKKIDACAEQVAVKFNATTDIKGAQAIFCDMGVPKAEKETDSAPKDHDKDDAAAEQENEGVYTRLISSLVAHGIPREQIAFAQSAKKKEQLDELFQKVDNGEIRVIIGSTQKMGAGTNFQHHLVAEHHLDAPWRPRDIEQREGRIIRQGNPNAEVEIFTYVVKDSFDANMWEKLKNKASIIQQAMSSDISARTLEDADMVTLSYADVEGAATGNPLIKEKLDADAQVTKYTNASVQFQREQQRAAAEAEELPKNIANAQDIISRIEDDAAHRTDTHGDKFSMTIEGKTYTKRTEVDKALKSAKLTNVPRTIGNIGGFDVHAWQSISGDVKVELVRNRAYPANKLNTASIERTMNKGVDDALKGRRDNLLNMQEELEQAQAKLKEENPYTAKLKAARDKQRELEQKINTLMTEDNKPSTDTKEAPTDTEPMATEPTAQTGEQFLKEHVVVSGVPEQSRKAKAKEEHTNEHVKISSFQRTDGGMLEPAAEIAYDVDAETQNTLVEIATEHYGFYSNTAHKFLFHSEYGRDAFAKEASEYLQGYPTKRYSIAQAKQDVARSAAEIKHEVLLAFPHAQNVQESDNGITFDMPNGTHIEVAVHDNMEPTGKEAARARAEHGYAPDVAIKVNGSVYTLSGKAVMDLSKRGETGTAYHEAMHVALATLFDDKAKHALFHKYGTEEGIADAYRDYMNMRATGKHHPYAKLMRQIRDFFERLASHLPGIGKAIETNLTARKAFEDLASGKAWGYNEQGGGNRGFSLFNRAEAAGKDIDNGESKGDNESRYIDEFLEQTLSKEDRADIDNRVENLIRENINDMRNGKKMPEEVRDGMALLKGLRSVYHNRGRLANSKVYGDKNIQELQQKIERLYAYARRRFDNDERIKRLIDEQNASSNRRENIRGGGKAVVSRNTNANASRNGTGSNSTVSVSTSGETSDLMQGFNRQLDEAMKHDVHYSISRSDNQGGFSSAKEQAMQEAEKSYIYKATDRLEKAMHLKSDKVVNDVINDANAMKNLDDNFNFKDATVKSPYRIAEKIPKFRLFFNMATRAMNEEVKNRNYFQRKLQGALNPLDEQGRADLTQIMLSGDAEGREYTDTELLADGTSEDVVKAYRAIRRLLNKAYHLANNARRNPVEKSARMSDAELQELRGNQFVKEILSVGKKDRNGKQLVSWREYRNYTHQYENVNEHQLATLQASEGVQILDTTEVGNGPDGKIYNVLVREGPADIHKLTGYVPHFFHDYFVRVVNRDGSSEVVGSGRTETEAIKIGEQYAKDHPLTNGQTIHISPKIFDIGSMSDGNSQVSESAYGAILGDMDFFKMQEAVAKNNDMTLDEAKRLLDGSVRMKNRHRSLGNAMHRKGAKGFETDMEWVLSHYFNTVSRYAAMESEFKPKAISMFERMFGDFNKDHSGLAKYVKDYINDINGNPSALEQIINKALQSTALFRKFITPVFGERAALTMGNGIANKISYLTLGLNMSSALLNFTQLMNSAAYLGNPALIATMVAKGRYHKYTRKELRILAETGVLNDIGLDSGSGYDQARAHIRRASSVLGKVNNTIDAAGHASMMFFREADAICRRGTVLAAYELARQGKAPGHKGHMMTHDEAIAYAKDVNRRANFDYGVADAANVFRRGSIVSQLALQFKKYGFKELEVMADFSPWSKKTSRAQKAMFWGMYFMLAGVLGIPALDWFDDEFGGLKDDIQSFIIRSVGNKKLAEVIMYGMPALAGMNLSSRAGLSDVIPTQGIDLTGPLASKLYQLKRDGTRWLYQGGDWATVLRDVSPGMYNLVAAYRGETYDRRGRVNDRYTTTWDRIMRAVGFKSTDESISTDVQRIIRNQKSKRTTEEQGAIDAAIKDPSSKNLAKLKELGISPKRFQDEKAKKGTTKNERTSKSVPKRQRQDYDYLLNFAQE